MYICPLAIYNGISLEETQKTISSFLKVCGMKPEEGVVGVLKDDIY